MTNFDKIKTMNVEELAEFLVGTFEEPAWTCWFDEKYCYNCESTPNGDTYCAANHACKVFPEHVGGGLSGIDCIKAWLEEEND